MLLPVLLAGCDASSATARHDGRHDAEPDPRPHVVLEPDTWSFGYVAPGSTETASLQLRNIGDAAAEIRSVATSDPAFVVDAPAVPFTLDAYTDLALPVMFAPVEAADFDARLDVTVDPIPDAWVELQGWSMELPPPVAVCSVEPPEAVAIFEEVTLQGGDSYDPLGEAIADYTWRLLEQPAGSNARAPAGGASRTGFTADEPGTYTFELVVTSARGVTSEPCVASLEATARGSLWVELTWTHANDDLDLHLVAPNGSLESNDDCYYANCTYGLDWGVDGDTEDDPRLELDDIPGTGPEIIDIEQPAAGTYTVIVNDYPGSVYNGDNDAAVNIWVDGVLAWSGTRVLSEEDEYVTFATVTFPDGAVLPAE